MQYFGRRKDETNGKAIIFAVYPHHTINQFVLGRSLLIEIVYSK